MKHRFLLTVLLGTGLAFTACKKGAETNNTADSTAATAGAAPETQTATSAIDEATASIRNNLKGKWKVTKAEGGAALGLSANGVGDVLTFNEDGTFTNQPASGAAINGTWDVQTLQLKVTVGGQEASYGPSMDSQQCILESNGVRVEMARQ